MLKYLIFGRFIHILFDFFLVYSAFLLAYFIRVNWVFSTDFKFGLFMVMSFLGSSLWVLFLAFTRYYRIPPRTGVREWYDLALVLVGGVIANGVLIVVYFFPQEILFSRLISVYAFILGTIFLISSQLIFRQAVKALKKGNKASYRLLIVGANSIAANFIKQIELDPYALYQVVGVIDPYGLKKTIEGSTVLGKLDKLEKVVQDLNVTAILQCDAFEQTLNLISFCEQHDIKFQFDPALRGIFEKNLRIREVAGHTTISFVKRDFKNNSKRKRYAVIDAVLSQVFDID